MAIRLDYRENQTGDSYRMRFEHWSDGIWRIFCEHHPRNPYDASVLQCHLYGDPLGILSINLYGVGIISGLTGAAGNLGGVIFAIIFRYHGKNYARAIWVCGCLHIAMNLAVIWIRPIPKGQIGGR